MSNCSSSCSTPSSPTISKTSGSTVCGVSNQTVTLTATGCSGGSITWYQGSTQVGTGTTYTTSTVGTYTAKCTVGSCISAASNSITVTETSGCGASSNCYEMYLAGNLKRISNHNGIPKVKDLDNSNSQIWQLQDMGNGYVKIVSKGSTNGTAVNNVLGIRNQGTNIDDSIDLQPSVNGDHQLWLKTALTGNDTGRYKFIRKGTSHHLGSVRNWGDGILSDGESDLSLAYDPDNIFGNNKILLVSKPCPNTNTRIIGKELGNATHNFDPENDIIDDNSIVLYPNPVENILYLKIQDTSSVKSIQIYSITSILIYENSTIPTEGIDVKSLTPGVYLINITYLNGSSIVKKVVKL